MNALQIVEGVCEAFRVGLVPNVIGSPGIGKSDIFRLIAKKFKLFVIDLRLSQCDPTDLMGFPTHNGDRMGYAPPKHFPLKGMDKPPAGYNGWLLFLDELNSAPLSVQAAAFKLIQDKMVGIHHLHPDCYVACAGNLETDGGIVNRVSTPMQSRLIHMPLEVDPRLWINWATENHLDHRVISYIEGRPDHLHEFDPNHNDRTFACPRTWEFTSKLIKDREVTSMTLQLLIGTLSAGIAHGFNDYITYCHELPSLKDILAKPMDIPIPIEPALLHATSHMVAAFLNENNAVNLMLYVDRLPVEFGTTAMRSALKRNPDSKELLKVPAIRTWAHKIAEELF